MLKEVLTRFLPRCLHRGKTTRLFLFSLACLILIVAGCMLYLWYLERSVFLPPSADGDKTSARESARETQERQAQAPLKETQETSHTGRDEHQDALSNEPTVPSNQGGHWHGDEWHAEPHDAHRDAPADAYTDAHDPPVSTGHPTMQQFPPVPGFPSPAELDAELAKFADEPWFEEMPDEPEKLQQWASMYLAYDDARSEAATRKMYQQHPDYFPSAMLFRIGLILLSADKPAEAIPYFKKVAQFGPGFAVSAALGQCYEKIGELEAALTHWENAAELHAADWAAWEKHRRGHPPIHAGMAEISIDHLKKKIAAREGTQ